VEGKTSGVLGGGVRELGFRKELVAALQTKRRPWN
jgi:hypothetical protein